MTRGPALVLSMPLDAPRSVALFVPPALREIEPASCAPVHRVMGIRIKQTKPKPDDIVGADVIREIIAAPRRPPVKLAGKLRSPWRRRPRGTQ